MFRPIILAAPVLLAGCLPDDETDKESVVRTVRSMEAVAEEPEVTRNFPAVLEPPDITELAFDVGGRLGAIDLKIGQDVAQGDVLANVEATDASLRLQQAEAGLAEAEAALVNAREEANRQRELSERDVVSDAARDRAVTAEQQALARVEQARKNLELLEESLSDTALEAPFDGIVNSIEVKAFGSVAAGQPVLTLYPDTALQATVLVSYDIVSTLSLGQPVEIVPSDGARTPLAATVTEIARRAPAVSSFPVVVSLGEMHDDLRSGMAVDVFVGLPVPEGPERFPIPIGALALNRPGELATMPRSATVFVVEPGEEGTARTVPREVEIDLVVGDRVFVIDGLQEGDRVVTAGVSFLNPGQEVRVEAQAGTGDRAE